MDGYAIAQAARAKGTASYLVAMTGYGQTDDRRDTSSFGSDRITSYPACGPQDEHGNEVYYRLEVTTVGMFHVYAIDAEADIDVHVLRDAPAAAGCLARGDTTVDIHLDPGTYFIAADTFSGKAGDYTIVVMRD